MRGRFFLPGPTEVRPEILAAQARPMIAHRGADFVSLMADLQPGLKDVFRTDRPVLVAASSATGFMEAGIRNSGTGPVLSLVNGAFSERFAEIAVACGRRVDRIEVGWGAVHDPDEVRRALGRRDYDAVTVVHSETSTGALNPVAEIAGVVREHGGPLLLVDSVTGVGGAELHTDAWGLDFVLTGSHKALALPPGLAFAVASPRMMEASARTPGKGLYFDLVTYARNMETFQTPTTPALTLLYALQDQLRRILSETMEGRWARHMAMARRTWSWVEEEAAAQGIAMRVVAPEGHRSPTVTAVALPGGVDPRAVVGSMAELGWVVGAGYGQGKGTDFRIGHMGDHTLEELETMLAVLGTVLR
ncbi:MAG TPA: alanine--glyoxylate aminotransferase family protein [Longimicrobiales bacterium]|nr:alanine--glyoxylate aminotransferase family protein [Longimicrobiales bacterium]